MEGTKGIGEVEFEEVKRPGFLERFKSLFMRKNRGVAEEKPGITVLSMEHGVVKPVGVKIGEEKIRPVSVSTEHISLNEIMKIEQRETPMVKILPKEENRPVGGKVSLVEVVKPVKLEKDILGLEEEKEITKFENRLRKKRLLFEKKLKEKVEELEKRKVEIEQSMILESEARREAELNRREEIVDRKEKEIDTVIRGHQLEREEELNRKEKELIMKEKELAQITEQKIDEDVKKLLAIMDELLGKLPKEVIDGFVKSDDYKLYEKVLDKYGV